MSSQTCDYVASRDNPESWHGTDSVDFFLQLPPEVGGLGITEWHCPHPPLGENDRDGQYCVFHTDPAEIPDDVDQREALLEALNEAGDCPRDDRPEHRGQFVGATFGAINLSGETIVATDEYDIRFDYAQFEDVYVNLNNINVDLNIEDNLYFEDTTFVTKGQYPISFWGATFRTNGDGDVLFTEATFRTDGDGDVLFNDATFRTDGDGAVRFTEATFRTDGDGAVRFTEATFRTGGYGDVWFKDATFRADGDGDVVFNETTFGTDVVFTEATFRTDGDGDVVFTEATFRANAECDVVFTKATFRTNGDGGILFNRVTLTNTDLSHVDFAEANLRGAVIADTDLREASVADISVDGSTTCKRLYEGYIGGYFIINPTIFPLTFFLNILVFLRRLYKGSGFDSSEWDATARAYHNLKTVFSEHGLVGKARDMHVRERRSRNLEAKAANGRLDSKYLGSLPSRVITGYGVGVRNLVFWMLVLFVGSTMVYLDAEVETSVIRTIAYSVLAFTVAPPMIPEETGTQIVMMIETFLGTLFIVLLGYILGTRDQF